MPAPIRPRGPTPERPGGTTRRQRRPTSRMQVLTLGALAYASPASADRNDFELTKLAHLDTAGAVATNATAFRTLASQLGAVLAVPVLTPADTEGFGGFGYDLWQARTSTQSGSHWQVRDGGAPSGLWVSGVQVRKAMWFPLPSFELGGGISKVSDSSLWAAHLSAKLALLEGYPRRWVPSLAVRGAVARLMSQRQLDLTIPSAEVLASKALNMGDTWQLTPYAAWGLLIMVARAEVMDLTPLVDPLTAGNQADARNNFTFRDQLPIYRQRLVVGARAKYGVVGVAVEAQYISRGTSVDELAATSKGCEDAPTSTPCEATDASPAQIAMMVAGSLAF